MIELFIYVTSGITTINFSCVAPFIVQNRIEHKAILTIILTLPLQVSLSSFAGEGWGEVTTEYLTPPSSLSLPSENNSFQLLVHYCSNS